MIIFPPGLIMSRQHVDNRRALLRIVHHYWVRRHLQRRAYLALDGTDCLPLDCRSGSATGVYGVNTNTAQDDLHHNDNCGGPLIEILILHNSCYGRNRMQSRQQYTDQAPQQVGCAVFKAARHETRRPHRDEHRHAAPCRGTKHKGLHDFDANVRYGDFSGFVDLHRVACCYLWGRSKTRTKTRNWFEEGTSTAGEVEGMPPDPEISHTGYSQGYVMYMRGIINGMAATFLPRRESHWLGLDIFLILFLLLFLLSPDQKCAALVSINHIPPTHKKRETRIQLLQTWTMLLLFLNINQT